MAALTTQKVTLAGTTPTYVAASAGGDTFVPGPHVFLHFKNTSGSSYNITIPTPNTLIGLAVADAIVTITASSERMIGPFPAQHFADPADGRVDVTYTGVTSLTVAVLELDTL